MTPKTRKLLALTAVGVGGAIAVRTWLRSSSYTFRDKTVVIAGGSRGLGLEMARLWAAEGARVALCARTGEDIQRAVSELRRGGADAIGLAGQSGHAVPRCLPRHDGRAARLGQPAAAWARRHWPAVSQGA